MNETLEPISPAEAKEMYLNVRKHEVSEGDAEKMETVADAFRDFARRLGTGTG